MPTIDGFIASKDFQPGLITSDSQLVRQTFTDRSGATTTMHALFPAVGSVEPSSDQYQWQVTAGSADELGANALWGALARVQLVNDPVLSAFAIDPYITSDGQWTPEFRQQTTLYNALIDVLAVKTEDNLFRTKDVLTKLEAAGTLPPDEKAFGFGGWLRDAVKVAWRGATWVAESENPFVRVGFWTAKEAAGGIIGNIAFSAATYGYHAYEAHKRAEALERARERRRERRGRQGIVPNERPVTELLATLAEATGAETSSVGGWEQQAGHDLGGYVMEAALVSARESEGAVAALPAEPDVLSLDIDLHR